MNGSVKKVSQEQRWFDNLDKVLKFYSENGYYPKTSDIEHGGTWLANQRFYFKENNGALSSERIRILNEKLPGWNLPLAERKKGSVVNEDENIKWMRLFEKVKKYYDSVNIYPVFNDRKNGGTWLVNQRNDYKRGVLDIDKKKMLDDNLPNWNIDLTFDEFEMNNWYKHLLLVKSYYLKNNKFPYDKCLENGSNWLNGQRKMFKNGTLSLDKIEILDRELPGWSDVVIAYESLDEKWMKFFEAVKSYYKKYGTFPHTTDYENGGRWLIHQRRLARNGKLANYKIALLDKELPGWLTTNNSTIENEKKWYENYAVVKAYCLKYGDRPSFNDTKNKGAWLGRQRKLFEEGLLSLEKIKLLDENIPNWRSGNKGRTDDDSWFESLAKVKKYHDINNSYPIHTDIENGGMWLINQRQFLKRGKLREDRKEILDKLLPNWVEGSKHNSADNVGWMKNLLEVKEYYLAYGFYPKKADKEHGGNWLYRQHRYFVEGRLREDRKQLLDDNLPGWNFYKKRVSKIESSDKFKIVSLTNNGKKRVRKD